MMMMGAFGAAPLSLKIIAGEIRVILTSLMTVIATFVGWMLTLTWCPRPE
jgi:hypothetical protein